MVGVDAEMTATLRVSFAPTMLCWPSLKAAVDLGGCSFRRRRPVTPERSQSLADGGFVESPKAFSSHGAASGGSTRYKRKQTFWGLVNISHQTNLTSHSVGLTFNTMHLVCLILKQTQELGQFLALDTGWNSFLALGSSSFLVPSYLYRELHQSLCAPPRPPQLGGTCELFYDNFFAELKKYVTNFWFPPIPTKQAPDISKRLYTYYTL